MSDNLQILVDLLPRLGEGVLVTLELTVGGAVLALLVAFVLGLAGRARTRWARVPSRVVVEFFRGTSLVVQIFWLYYVLPLPPFYVELDPLACGIIALGLNYGAYAAEVVRGSINAVPTGQWEAATALDMGPVHRLRRVILPQAWPLMMPLFTNLLIQLVKGSALATYVSLHDLNFFIGELRKGTTETVFAYTVGLLVYFAIAYALTLVMNALEARAKNNVGQGPSLREILRLTPARVDTAEVRP
ncbi:ectoine/hydroxyectoine ABC transporter permease subunit EhuC [Promicromonospora citrea]|uniref:Ectoine/hydroxyectoine ABC transporter permease subunit EhuC n=1 Tax=Promicromonospora citrea TaxID=43677 RepID=A0A8H9GH71_9MICO|nr:ectoine/hydroxyectoine ABC transporter permease subunit EhuC [Promicromonospora citrea]NNH53114.1 ectoine/hydroxyectoine ABC transporter permease subunit EhuC [Promicromonospora citrea]GGM18397.1 ectoine/hydroxyectoine ABC transporter permease subunit EhuC [Promicromonospora citrea]